MGVVDEFTGFEVECVWLWGPGRLSGEAGMHKEVSQVLVSSKGRYDFVCL